MIGQGPGSGPNPQNMGGAMNPISPGPNQGPQVPEQPYMQQQSYIFVFSTELANRAADAVFQGRFPSIIDAHMQEKETQNILSRNVLNRPPGLQRSHLWPGLQRSGSGQGPPGQMMAAGPNGPGPVYRNNFAGCKNNNQFGQGPPNMPYSAQQQQQQNFNEPCTLPDNMLTAEQARIRADKLEKLRQMKEKLLPDDDGSGGPGQGPGAMMGMGGPAPPPPYPFPGNPSPGKFSRF